MSARRTQAAPSIFRRPQRLIECLYVSASPFSRSRHVAVVQVARPCSLTAIPCKCGESFKLIFQIYVADLGQVYLAVFLVHTYVSAMVRTPHCCRGSSRRMQVPNRICSDWTLTCIQNVEVASSDTYARRVRFPFTLVIRTADSRCSFCEARLTSWTRNQCQ